MCAKYIIADYPICTTCPTECLETKPNQTLGSETLGNFGLEEQIGMEKLPAKRGPAFILQRQIEQIRMMARAKQKFTTEMLDP